MNNLKDFLDNFPRLKILVVGDLILDLYVKGVVERISPEAPVPVVLEKSREYVLGGAGNVAANIASLNSKVTLAGVCGSDSEAEIMRKLCSLLKITPLFVGEKGRPTPLKTRVTADRHQMLRIDREFTEPIGQDAEARMISALSKSGDYDAVILSDYAKGCVTARLVAFLKKRFGKDNIFIGVKPQYAGLYKGAGGVLVLNLKEAKILTGVYGETDILAASAAKKMAEIFSASVVLTRGERGMTIYDRARKKASHISARAIQVYDVTGAGDTALAVFAMMSASGADLYQAGEVANAAAGIVVGFAGTATVRPKELKDAIGDR